ncbi:MAG: 1-deoxy-D-xylulose-5-phosphate reductoisomerase [Bacillota bacterium]
MVKRISILGSTGSIGRQTLEVVDRFTEELAVVGLAAGNNIDLLARQVSKYNPEVISAADADGARRIKREFPQKEVLYGAAGLEAVAVWPGADTVVTSITGTLGLVPTVAAIRAKKDVALANKETLVAAGELVMEVVKACGVRILPVDSEHSAIFQCLQGEQQHKINKLILTASGGPFRDRKADELADITPEMALRHPNWSMGKKITIDSATLMNKGLEVIEAKWLFGVELDNVQVVIHPESIIHSMVEFVDGSVIAQLGLPDMRLPIQYALTFPERRMNDFPRLNIYEIQGLHFAPPDSGTFRCLELAYAAGRTGGTMPAVMNAANEIAVDLFLAGRITFPGIAELVERVMQRHEVNYRPDLDGILAADAWARRSAMETAGLKPDSRKGGK